MYYDYLWNNWRMFILLIITMYTESNHYAVINGVKKDNKLCRNKKHMDAITRKFHLIYVKFKCLLLIIINCLNFMLLYFVRTPNTICFAIAMCMMHLRSISGHCWLWYARCSSCSFYRIIRLYFRLYSELVVLKLWSIRVKSVIEEE